jgi:hypothetical protein
MKGAKRPNGASHQAEACREQRDAPVHCLEQVIEEQDHCDIARRGSEVGYKPAVDRHEGEHSRHKGKQIKAPAILPLKRDDASAIHSSMTAVLIIVSPYDEDDANQIGP